jgi:hypothetical protein
MRKPASYEPILSGKASAYLVSLPGNAQRKIIALLFQLAEMPSQLGDYSSRDNNGRDIQHILVGDWHISFWADDAVKEFRIVEFTEV